MFGVPVGLSSSAECFMCFKKNIPHSRYMVKFEQSAKSANAVNLSGFPMRANPKISLLDYFSKNNCTFKSVDEYVIFVYSNILKVLMPI